MRSAQSRLRIEAGEPGHVHVENHASGTSHIERCKKRVAGSKGDDIIISQTQEAPERGAHRDLVVHHGNARFGSLHIRETTDLLQPTELDFGAVKDGKHRRGQIGSGRTLQATRAKPSET